MTEFEQVYRDCFADVYRYIRRLSGDAQIAEEITSETFCRAMRAMDHFRGECDVRVWLCQIAKNCYYAQQKKHARCASAEDEALQAVADPQAGPDEQVARQETARQLRQLLHTLPEPYKEVFLWRVFAELSFRQIGQIFGKTDNWACVTYHRARAMLKQRMGECDSET